MSGIASGSNYEKREKYMESRYFDKTNIIQFMLKKMLVLVHVIVQMEEKVRSRKAKRVFVV